MFGQEPGVGVLVAVARPVGVLVRVAPDVGVLVRVAPDVGVLVRVGVLTVSVGVLVLGGLVGGGVEPVLQHPSSFWQQV